MVGKVTPNDQLSASEIPVLMGASKFKTVNELLKEKMDFISGIEKPFKTNEAMEMGNVLEDTILEQSCKRLGLDSYKLEHLKPYYHETLPFAVSLDGTVAGRGLEIMTDMSKGIICVNADKVKMEGFGVIEAKLTANEVESADLLPLYRGVLQLQMQMDTVGASWGALCVLYRGTTLRTFVYERDSDTVEQIHAAIIDFQRRLDKFIFNDETEWYDFTTPAEASNVFDHADHADKDEISLPSAELDAGKIVELRQLIKDIEANIAEHEVKIMDGMRDNQHAISGRYKIAWPMINYKATAEKVVPAKPARTLRQSKLRIREIL